MSDGWSSKGAFVLASIGAAVGLGNVWRFPYIASGNGGFWFLGPYLVCLLVVGIPLFLLETGQGFACRAGFAKSVERSKDVPFVKRQWRRMIGTFPVVVSTVILGYYAALCAWTVWFAAEFILGNNPTFGMMQQSYTPLAAFVVVLAAAFYIASKGISRGIEPVTGYLVPLLFAFLLVLFAYSATLPGAGEALQGALSGGPEKMLEAKTWYYALSQVLFSLSVGYGIMFTYGLHLKSGKGIFSSAFKVAGADTAAAVLAFFTVVMVGAAVGSPASGLALSFDALPAFFGSQGLLGTALGAAFFALLFSAAFTSVLSMIEHTRVSIGALGAGGRLAVWWGVFAIGAASVLSYSPMALTAFGKPVLDVLDFAFGTFLAPFSAIAVVFACAYLLPHERIARRVGIPAKYERLFVFVVRKVLPFALALLIVYSQIAGLY